MGWGEGFEPGDFGFWEGISPVSQPLPHLLSQSCQGHRPRPPGPRPSVGTLYGSGCWEVWMWGGRGVATRVWVGGEGVGLRGCHASSAGSVLTPP